MLQASRGRSDKLQQEQTSPNHAQVSFPSPVEREALWPRANELFSFGQYILDFCRDRRHHQVESREGELINRSAAEGEDDALRLIMHEGAEVDPPVRGLTLGNHPTYRQTQ